MRKAYCRLIFSIEGYIDRTAEIKKNVMVMIRTDVHVFTRQ